MVMVMMFELHSACMTMCPDMYSYESVAVKLHMSN